MNGFKRYNNTNWLLPDSDLIEPLKYILRETDAKFILLKRGKEAIQIFLSEMGDNGIVVFDRTGNDTIDMDEILHKLRKPEE